MVVPAGGGLLLLVQPPPPLLEDAFHLLHVLVADALAAAVAPLQAVEDVFPHRDRRLQAARPLPATLQLPAEAPLAREALGGQEAALPRLRVGVGPLDFHTTAGG